MSSNGFMGRETPGWIKKTAAHIVSIRGSLKQEMCEQIIMDRIERQSRCLVCFATGQKDGRQCPNCRGVGFVMSQLFGPVDW